MSEYILGQREQKKARDLLNRAGCSQRIIDDLRSGYSLHIAIDVVANLIGDIPPDENWLRDYYLINGDHMVLTEEGWIPAEMNTREYTGAEPCEVLDEVNAPKRKKQKGPSPCPMK